MAQLSREAVYALARQVGIGQLDAAIAGAICDAESGRRTDALGINPGSTLFPQTRDRGLWQINDFWHPDVSDACAFDAGCNARAMARISSQGTNWHPWATFNSGAYRQFLPLYLQLAGFAQPVVEPPHDVVGDLQRRIRAGYPLWKATLEAYESLVTQVRRAVFQAPVNSTDLGSPRF